MTYSKSSISLVARWGVLFGVFFIMLITVSLLSGVISQLNINVRTAGLLIAAIQGILLFIVPSLVYARVVSPSPWKELELTKGLEMRQAFGVLLLFIVALPALNQIIFWNGEMSLPTSMEGIEETLRQWENQAQASSEVLLSTSSFGGMICGVLVVGVLTGIAEELFFRGAIQRSMEACGINYHMAVWTSAFIFSTLHFQFFGFVPRLLLGAFFGYLLVWSRSLWVSAFAHALNNSVVVVTAWLIRKDIVSVDIEKMGLATEGFPWMAFISVILLGLLVVYGRRYLFFPSLTRIKPLRRNLR